MTPEAPLAEIPLIPPVARGPAWTELDILVVVIFGALSLAATSLIALTLAPHATAFHGSTRASLLSNPIFLIPVQAIAYILAFLFTRVFITLRAQREFWSAIEWNLLPMRDMLTFSVAGVVLAFVTQVAGHFLPIPKELPMDKYFTEATSVYLMMAFGLLVAPLAEEILFRGLIFPVAVRRAGLAIGTIITALLFALIHQGQLAHAWAPLLLLFGVGMALTIVRAAAKSVAASWMVHFSYNATLFALLLYATSGLKHLERLSQ